MMCLVRTENVHASWQLLYVEKEYCRYKSSVSVFSFLQGDLDLFTTNIGFSSCRRDKLLLSAWIKIDSLTRIIGLLRRGASWAYILRRGHQAFGNGGLSLILCYHSEMLYE